MHNIKTVYQEQKEQVALQKSISNEDKVMDEMAKNTKNKKQEREGEIAELSNMLREKLLDMERINKI